MATALFMTAAVAAFAGAGPALASAGGGPGQGPQPEVLTVSGPFTGSGQLLSGCGIFNQIVDGGGEWSPLGPTTFHLDFCTDAPPDGVNYPTNGTFTITTPEGTLSGTMSGSVQAGGLPPPEVGFPFVFDLVVTSGTGRFATATGTFVLDGAFSYGAFSVWGDASGTVTIPPGQPQSVEDCKRGGWRNYVDDEGRPFRSQGHCIRYVLHHP